MNISRRVNYRNFGYIPGNGFIRDLYGWLFGYRNLYKRLQARDMMKVLNIQPDETVLDIGCGRGFITVEIAKQAKLAYGVDVDSVITEITIPKGLENKLKYVTINPGDPLPFEDSSMDKIFASEIIAAVSDTTQFLGELKRLLKPGGKLVLCNGAGHPAIKAEYANPSQRFLNLKKQYPDSLPETYKEYCAILNKIFSNQVDWFYEKEHLEKILTENGFKTGLVSYSPGLKPGTWMSWQQFTNHVKGGSTLSQNNFLLKHFVFSMMQRFDNRKYEGGILYEAINEK